MERRVGGKAQFGGRAKALLEEFMVGQGGEIFKVVAFIGTMSVGEGRFLGVGMRLADDASLWGASGRGLSCDAMFFVVGGGGGGSGWSRRKGRTREESEEGAWLGGR